MSLHGAPEESDFLRRKEDVSSLTQRLTLLASRKRSPSSREAQQSFIPMLDVGYTEPFRCSTKTVTRLPTTVIDSSTLPKGAGGRGGTLKINRVAGSTGDELGRPPKWPPGSRNGHKHAHKRMQRKLRFPTALLSWCDKSGGLRGPAAQRGDPRLGLGGRAEKLWPTPVFGSLTFVHFT